MRAHAELIKRWAEDETLEIEYCYENSDDEWALATPPMCWHPSVKYREKPKAKKKVEMWQWALSHKATPGKVAASQFYKNSDFLRQQYKSEDWKIICRIEGSKIEVEE